MKRIRITIEIDITESVNREFINLEAIKLSAIAARHGRVVYVATEIVTNADRNVIISKD